eukprot:c7388_g1_i1 orf=466-726(+)
MMNAKGTHDILQQGDQEEEGAKDYQKEVPADSQATLSCKKEHCNFSWAQQIFDRESVVTESSMMNAKGTTHDILQQGDQEEEGAKD